MPPKRYAVGIPAGPAVHGDTAAAILPGQVLSLVHVRQSLKEHRVKKLYQRVGMHGVTPSDVTRAEIRHAAVLAEHVTQEYHAGVPGWAQDFAAQLKAELGTMLGTLGTNLDVKLTKLDAKQDNIVARMRNREALARVPQGLSVTTIRLFPLRKTVPGWGALAAGVHLPAGGIRAVGSFVQRPDFPFPVTVADLRNMSINDIKILAVAFNESFGLVAGDSLAEMQGKLETFISL